MKQAIFFFAILTTFFACKRENKFPPLITQKVSKENLTLLGQYANNPKAGPAQNSFPGCLQDINQSVEFYQQKDEGFNFPRFKNSWEDCKVEIHTRDLDSLNLNPWIEATGLLLQVTAEAKYAEELEYIYLNSKNPESRKAAASFVFTKNVDHLNLNLFLSAKIEYNHTMDGKVEVVQETDYPNTGRVELKFSMEKARYIELQIRIPSWAKDAQVTVKGVKYFAPAGGYCFIAKKWHEGDSVEIVFPGIRNKIPV